MNLQSVVFESSAALASQLPRGELPEIVFSGRSNVGKSSLINRLCNRKGLARVSAAPGKTATVNFYRGADVRLVDLPGYGFARVSKEEKARWAGLVEGYFAQPRPVRLVVQLADFRHAPTRDDEDMFAFLRAGGWPFVTVCTKADKLNRTQTAAQLALYASLFDSMGERFLPVSSQTGEGIEELRRLLAQALCENAPAR